MSVRFAYPCQSSALLRKTDNRAPTTVKLIFSILISYPLAAVLKRIPDSKPTSKNLFIAG